MNNLVTIEIDTIPGGVCLCIDKAQTSIGFVAHGIISGALKAYYADCACDVIAKCLGVSAGLSDSIELLPSDVKYANVANRIYHGVRKLFEDYISFEPENYELEIARCCRYIIDELNIKSANTCYFTIEECKIAKG